MSILASFLQNPQMIEALAARCGIDPAQAEAVIQQCAPALAGGLHAQLSAPAGSSDAADAVQAAVAGGTHAAVASDPSALAAHDSGSTQNLVGHLLGGSEMAKALTNKVAAATGLDPQTLSSMLPTLAAVVMGAAATQSAASGGMQGLLGSLEQSASAMGGSNGSLLGSLMGMVEKKIA